VKRVIDIFGFSRATSLRIQELGAVKATVPIQKNVMLMIIWDTGLGQRMKYDYYKTKYSRWLYACVRKEAIK